MKKLSIFLMLMALFAPLAMKAFDYTVCDGSSTNEHVPLSGITSGYTKFKIPGNYLTEMADDWIYSMTFYVSTSTPENWYADVTVYMKEIEDGIELSELEFTDDDVVSSAVYCNGSTIRIGLDHRFDYHGGTLAIGMYVNDGNEVDNVAFYGVEIEEWELSAGSYYFNAITGQEMEIFFLPKITFELEVIQYDCPTPSHLTINYSEGETTAEVSWDVFDKNTGGNGNTYVFPQFESDFNTRASSATGYFYVDVNGNTTRTSDNPYTIQGIQPATNYTVSVQTECDDDASGWATTSFFSGGSNTPLWSEDFEGGTMPTGWTTDGPGTWTVGTGDHSTSTGAGQGDYNALIKHGSTGDVTKLITPAIDLSSVSTAELSFMHIQRSWFGDVDQLRVYYRTSSSGTWTQLVAYTEAVASWTTENEIVLPNLSSTYQLAFEFTDKIGYGLGIDDIVIEQGASCIKPINFAGTASSQSVTLTWESDAPQWAVAYSTNPTADPSENVVTTVSSPTYTMNNLAINEDHYFWVRANCSATDQSAWEGPLHIGYCLPAPTSVDNDGISNVTFGTGDYIVNNDTPKATYTDYSTQIGAVQAGVEASIAITFKTGYTYNTYVWVDLDKSFTFDADEVICYGESTNTNPTTLSLNFTIPVTQTLGDFRMRIGSADSGLGSDPAAADPCYIGTYACFQDYTLRVLEAPSCMPASDVTVENITTTSAVISWTNYNGADATYTVMQGETVLTTTAVDSYTLEGLTAATTYPAGTFTIISSCDETMIANVPAFATECDHITTLPWSEDFESFANNTVPMCWDNSASTSLANGTSNDYYIWGVYTYNDNNMMRMCNYLAQDGTALINSPMIELPADVVYQLSFDYAHTATCGAFHVNISEDNGVTWVELGSYTNEGNSTSYTDPGTFIPVEPIFLTDYAGKTVMLQFYADANYGQGAIFVDNISITEAPSCLAPRALAATATAHSAELSWTARNGETEWTVYYKKSTDASYTEESGVTENPYTLDVEPSSIYEFYVVANCNADDASEPSDVYTFRTECEAFTITEDAPYTQNFEDPVVTSTWESSTGLEIPVCWENPYTTSTAQAGKPHLIAAGASYNYSNSQVLYFYGSGDNYVTLPEFDNELNSLTISFKWATESDTNGTLTLGYITAEDEDYNTFTEIKSFDACSESYRQMKEETVRLNDVSWDATRLAFRWSYTSQWSCNIDDLEVLQLPTFPINIDPYPVVQGRYDLGYYLIASPLADNVNPMSLGMITDEYGEDVAPENSTYDLYLFNQAEEMEWRNYRSEPFELVNGKGYLYASKDGVELHFTGTPYKGDGVIPLDYASDAPELMGWNLIGNPFPDEAIIDRTNYVLDNEGQNLVARSEDSEIPAMSGVFVQADDEGEFATFTVRNKSRGAEQSTIARTDIVVSDNNGKVLDNAIVRFDNGQTLGKFSLRANSTKIYVPFEGKNYAIVNAGQTGEMPINFVAKDNGTYALSFSNVGVDFSYLHLVDNLTGNDVDLLANPSYSFEAKTTDYSSRFKLVYAVKDGPSTGSGAFAFVSNGDIIVNGEGTLQVIDVMGRIIVSRDGVHTVSTNGMTPGVYMLRLVNGNDVKTQKIVIE